MSYSIPALSDAILPKLQHKVDTKTKPLGALGLLENLAVQIGYIQQTLTPAINKPHMLVFAGDHGVANSGVSAYPQVVTQQMVLNFLAGGAAINVFCAQHGIALKIIDAGVNAELAEHPLLVNAKVAHGTNNYLEQAAMSVAQCEQALASGKVQVASVAAQGCNTIAFGEMGIGNTSAAALLMHVLTGVPLDECVGKGTGLDDEGVKNKLALLQKAANLHSLSAQNPMEALRCVGGLEIAMMVGAFLEAARLQMVIVVDGFIASAAALVAVHLCPLVLEYCIFSHCSDEHGHKHMINALGVTPLLQLGLRLGEGSGAAVAMPLLQSAVLFLNKMASFEAAGVSQAEGN
ncbi:nicotinate-nucleotide--dimethylbenzimidazole phosphoribosyltransferase [Saccharophagus degradans]|uniref:Nicotinate-nucleotide--dimethylbenzimidazole phosphoribosyltransferase n=1 Tax=Saccharophagus degradans (strain 2-40 / ATCC 43961 / DSM 17024) TaxID=203122 RepID=Q21N37_SACD2|nr:nicotinate-nucleotide--dimethylbenzimidazole phosphoribosyltransferase [Saccharophagus degradans]ABD79892.1 Nicotinate-nucleotide-dimethylbenzimidazole phosphoribosyltransferase [Saccharophagus degradans 2-40]